MNMASLSKGSSKFSRYKKLEATEPTVKRQHWILAMVAGAYVIAVTAIVFAGYALTNVRYLTSGDGNALIFSNNSRVDDQTNQRNYALHPNDTEAEKMREHISSLNNELEALKHHVMEMNATMNALNLEASNAHLKEDETVARVSNLTEQIGEASATLAKLRASMEDFKLEVSNIRAKGGETASTVSTLMEQVETLNHQVSNIDAKKVLLTENLSKMNDAINAIVQRTSDLETKINAIAQRTRDLETKRTANNSSNSSFGPRKESAVVALLMLFLCLYYLCE